MKEVFSPFQIEIIKNEENNEEINIIDNISIYLYIILIISGSIIKKNIISIFFNICTISFLLLGIYYGCGMFITYFQIKEKITYQEFILEMMFCIIYTITPLSLIYSVYANYKSITEKINKNEKDIYSIYSKYFLTVVLFYI